MITLTRENIDQLVGKKFKIDDYTNYSFKILKDIGEYYWTKWENDIYIKKIILGNTYFMTLIDNIEFQYNHKNKEQFNLEPNKIFL